MQITRHQYGTLFNTPVELPADVRALICSHLTMAEFEKLSKSHKVACANFKRFKHIPVIKLFKKHFEYLSLNVSPLITEHPFKPDNLRGLETSRDFNSTKEFISGWLDEVYEWSKKVECREQAATFAIYYKRVSNIFKFSLLNKLAKKRLPTPNLNDIFYAVFAKIDLVSEIDKPNVASAINKHPLLCSVNHCKRLLRDLTYNSRREDERERIATFIKTYPLSNFLKDGLINLQDIPCDFVRLEVRRLLGDEIDFEVDLESFTRLTEELKTIALQSLSMQYEETKSTRLRLALDTYRNLNPLLFDSAIEEIEKASSGCYKLNRRLNLTIRVSAIVFFLICSAALLKDAIKNPKSGSTVILGITLVATILVYFLGPYMDDNERLQKQKELFLIK